MWFVVAFLSSELDVIAESSTVSLVCQIFDVDIVLLSIVVPLSSEPVEIVFAKTLLLYTFVVVTSELVSIETVMLESVESELFSLDISTIVPVSTMESVMFESFTNELWACEVSKFTYDSVLFCTIELSKMLEYFIVE